jgi:hypothetical protein
LFNVICFLVAGIGSIESFVVSLTCTCRCIGQLQFQFQKTFIVCLQIKKNRSVLPATQHVN